MTNPQRSACGLALLGALALFGCSEQIPVTNAEHASAGPPQPPRLGSADQQRGYAEAMRRTQAAQAPAAKP